MSGSKQWTKWERILREKLDVPDLLPQMQERSELDGHQDSKGRITYNQIANKKSFGAFSDILQSIAPREGIYNVPSIARTLKKDAFVYPWYYVQYTSQEDEDFDYSRSVTTGRPHASSLFEYMERKPNEPMIGICILENIHMKMFHGVAFIVWKKQSDGRRRSKSKSKSSASKDSYTFAYYDPIAYQRKQTRADGTVFFANYDFAKKTFQSHRFHEDVEFINLSDLCLKKYQTEYQTKYHTKYHTEYHAKYQTEYHCPQYVMNAEYCFLNSLYFLYKWIEFGKPRTQNQLQSVVNACYIVDPAKLSRSNTRESMTYRVIMMSFIITIFVRYFKALGQRHAQSLNAEEYLSRVLAFSDTWHATYGFHLLHPTLAYRHAS
jgi:hypothetical protein